MITRGSKIKLVKPFGKFNNNDVGKIFDVLYITGNGNILFKNKNRICIFSVLVIFIYYYI